LSLNNKTLEEINESDLQALIDDQVSEGKTIDYKRDAVGRTDADKKEFLADVSSFANASGGHLIIGMDEEKGLPTKLLGLEVADIDVEKGRLDKIILSGLQPRMVPSHQIQVVKLKESGRPLIVIRIPKSITMPHMITFQDWNKFYSRNSHGKYPLDVGEIRNLFVMSEAQLDRIKRFREERIAKIIADETPVKLDHEPRIVVHILPLSMSDPLAVHDLSDFPKGQNVFPMNTNYMDERRNFDGYLAFSRSKAQGTFGYVQFFRTGAVEAVDSDMLRERWKDLPLIIPSVLYEQQIVYGLRRYLAALASLKVPPPLLIMVSLLGVRGYNMAVDKNKYWGGAVPIKDGIDRDNLILPEVITDSYEVDLPKLLKPTFDAIWNATGWKESQNYDEQGKWTAG
jgi:hypothetical protein